MCTLLISLPVNKIQEKGISYIVPTTLFSTKKEVQEMFNEYIEKEESKEENEKNKAEREGRM